jgi:hypothetical protein
VFLDTMTAFAHSGCARTPTANIQDLLRGSKDAAVAATARRLFNTKFSAIGEMTDLSVDTKNYTCRARLQLAGEPEPVEIHVKKYRLEQRTEGATLTIVDATASRDWLTQVLQQFVVGREFTIPDRAAAVLKLLT